MPATLNMNRQTALLDAVRTQYRNLPLRELLHQSPQALLGVNEAAATVLETLGVKTVFDLATAGIFDDANVLLDAASNLKSALYQHGTPTRDLVREAEAAGVKVGELQFLPISVLERIAAAEAAAIQAALDVHSVRDLALYPPHRAAARILEAIYFPENTPDYDPERPADLLPKTGEYPTERVQYTTLLMGEIPRNDDDPIANIAAQDFKPLDLGKLAAGDAGFKRVAFGAFLTFNQSWYAQGVTLGQLLHSTTLAPGESTRVAVVDWSRKSRAGETEVISEVDDLTNDTSQNRSINEVTHAVANEAQGGFSSTNSSSTSTQEGTSSAAELSAPLGGLFGGPSGSVGHTSSSATTSAQADSYSTSWGHRDIGSSMMQNVNDRTHQHAHSSRSRRASVVKEVAQSEHENVSTRVLANYNHMHALTVQYYEVVQVYRVEVAIVKADKVVFIPLQLVDFDNEAMVRRFQGVLARAALSYTMREALQNLDVLEVAPERETRYTGLGGRLDMFLREALTTRTAISAISNVRVAEVETVAEPAADEEKAAAPALDRARLMAVKQPLAAARLSDALPVLQQVNDQLWSAEQTSRLSGLLNRTVLRADSNAMYLPTDVIVEGGAVAAGGTPLKILFHTHQGATLGNVGAANPVALSEVARISISGSSSERDLSATVTLTVNRNGVRFPLELPTVTVAKGATRETRVVQIKAGGLNVNIKQHLNQNRMHYSRAIFRSLDSTQLAWLLSDYGVEVDGKLVPIAQVVEPKPIRYVGNYLAFKMNTDAGSDRAFAEWLDTHGIHLGHAKEDIVPLPSGGTFAEAVLGRSNCAEKLDITRFWNWQDSPIPLQPTEIAAIQTGSRAMQEDVKPGQLSNPIINITTPASLPDPTGTAGVLAAIQNGSMFRDMSGLQATIGLAQATLQATSAGAAQAGEQAGTNMNNLLKANTERQRVAAEMITSLARTAASAYTGGAVSPGGGISGGGGHSQDGAKINYFDKTRGQAPAGGGNDTGSGGGAVAPIEGGASGGGGGGGGGSNGTWTGGGGASPGGFAFQNAGYSQNPAALAATWGDGEPRSALMRTVVDTFAGEGVDVLAGDAGAAKTNVQTKELNLAGVFEWDPSITATDELAELAANRWMPGADDFVAVAGGTVSVVPGFGSMLGAICMQADGSISRINLFTHANSDYIAFGGKIIKRTIGRADVQFTPHASNDNLAAMTPDSMTNLVQPGVFFETPTPINGKTKFTVADVRKKFAPGAVLVLYACHSGQSPAFLKKIAQFFQIKVIGFSTVVGYYPPTQNVPNKFVRTGERVGLGFGGTPVDNWRALSSHASAIAADP
ncbi:hypothetical protein IP90_00666 [Luteimonas cucumeris]|uniref:Uncharacterized protein n=1 Tax=Luteimonas cucumeris TaxID=985012 RepID=A0A562LA52_9GAMM|nr:hypothetical protein [Luteimonas cucumeris]TWI04533.1 hypothetical protein IP90_00666 [Luteimonas cucumeris]